MKVRNHHPDLPVNIVVKDRNAAKQTIGAVQSPQKVQQYAEPNAANSRLDQESASTSTSPIPAAKQANPTSVASKTQQRGYNVIRSPVRPSSWATASQK